MANTTLGEPCKTNADCGSPFMECDTSLLGGQTYTCRYAYGQYCQVPTECANNLKCINQYCQCVRNFYLEMISENPTYK